MGIKIKDKYTEVCSPANLYRAAHVTLLGGLRFKEDGALWKWQMEHHISRLHRELSRFTYKHGSYEVFKVYDPKERYILAAGIRDRVVHHALHDVIEPVMDRKFIHHSYACRKGKGQHQALRTTRSFLQRYDYHIHLDVKKFFNSIHRATLLDIIRRTVRDEGIDWLLTRIIDSSNNHAYAQKTGIEKQQLSLFDNTPSELHPKREAIPAPTDKVRGLPIGNLTSQLLANWYLNELDQFVKHRLKHFAYIRYMDDFVLFANRKETLKKLEEEITAYCEGYLQLKLHPSGGASRSENGLTFLGFRVFKGHMRLKGASATRMRNNLRYHIAHTDYHTPSGFTELFQRVQSFNAHMAHGNTYRLRQKVFGRYPVTQLMMDNGFKKRKILHSLREFA